MAKKKTREQKKRDGRNMERERELANTTDQPRGTHSNRRCQSFARSRASPAAHRAGAKKLVTIRWAVTF